MNQRPMIICNDIAYRQGFIEVAAGIHPHHINIEIWNIHPDCDISSRPLTDTAISDQEIIGNTEIELSISQTTALIESLLMAIQLAQRDGASQENHPK